MNPSLKCIPPDSPFFGAVKDEGWGHVIRANPVCKKEVDAAVGSTLAQYGRIDVVIHNNNEVIRVDLEDCGDEIYDQAMDVNAKSAFFCEI